LLEAFFNDADLLGISECILASDHLLKLLSKPGALIYVKFHLNFYFGNFG
jgi:hypothetical protein